jgi:transposase
MKRFVQGDNRTQSFLLPEALDDYVTDTNPVRVVDVFVDELDLQKLGFDGVEPALTGRPSYHPEVMLKIYYGYLNCIQSSRRLEREAQCNIELMWLTAAWHRTSRPLRDSAKTTAKRSAASAVSSSCYANA